MCKRNSLINILKVKQSDFELALWGFMIMTKYYMHVNLDGL